ncbi:hypothetical protein [Cellulomonas bogoriensis]|uniref:Uncharacterized protein n=1 Tax=Cellulomonas bogoriensis 69B4 = DSM 16987 TaxID=1386082 RepID=A0A0A0BZC0_9CELL|nr:hypothetical protein [Cellulomonas bogoriensis]KGM13062.1 hypothetical protein N869_16390 [Cellulomonas bogoriensis 69B4 = DSM 16987]
MRRVLTWTAAVTALAVVAGGGWYGWNEGWWQESAPVEPVAAATPDRDRPPARGQLPTGGDGPVQQGAGLPPFYELRPSLLGDLGPGWVLTVHRPARWDEDQWWESSSATVFVVSPEGRHYRVAEVDDGLDVAPVRWVAGERRVAVLVEEGGRASGEYRWHGGVVTPGWLDLLSGEIELDEDALLVGDGPWTWGRPLTSPDGRRVVERSSGAEVVVSTGRRERIVEHGLRGRSCAPVGWSDEDSVLLLCSRAPGDEEEDGSGSGGSADEEWDPTPVLFALDVDEESAERVRAYDEGEPQPLPWSGTPLAGGGVAYVVESRPTGCGEGVEVWDGDGTRAVQGSGPRGDNRFSVEVADGALFVASSPGCGEAAAVELTRHDLGSGRSRVLSAVVGEPWVQGLVGWAVAEDLQD